MKMALIFLTMFLIVGHHACHLPTVTSTRYYGTITARKGGVTDSEKAVRRLSETVTRVKESAEIHVSVLALRRGGLVIYQGAQECVSG